MHKTAPDTTWALLHVLVSIKLKPQSMMHTIYAQVNNVSVLLSFYRAKWTDGELSHLSDEEVCPPSDACSVIHLPFPSSPPSTATMMNVLAPFITFLEGLLQLPVPLMLIAVRAQLAPLPHVYAEHHASGPVSSSSSATSQTSTSMYKELILLLMHPCKILIAFDGAMPDLITRGSWNAYMLHVLSIEHIISVVRPSNSLHGHASPIIEKRKGWIKVLEVQAAGDGIASEPWALIYTHWTFQK
ncbi:uncharacterized protein LAESUDRAFT_714294 [Laetiporus sulphureus 93-53]|uniref:Uncharacterized protein n=1 Tax=Laetiporus sulphureus 93-53 TaxID=1314785 RepID=A0A165EA79_9APHY|nr:uncharacterized protein LAESUDRAFT_714294 [Laetiporus sulphureus 93-53]KZT06576.1 hypothetical protein LAESUDRAFT_714294 [Laetiporus sulphureus 93-53]